MISTVPPELTERTLSLCHPRDVATFAQTCRRAYTLVYRSSDQYLWRTLFLTYPFDDPRLPTGSSSSPHSKVDWCAKLQRRVRAERIARRDGDRREFVDVLLECTREAAPWAPRESSHNVSWVKTVLTVEASPWVEQFLRLGLVESLSLKLLASDAEKLRAHLALSLDHGAGPEALNRLKALRQMSRARVYDLRNYTREAHWGPFTSGGDCVDWSHINAIVTVITMNLRDFGVHWPKMFKPQATIQGLEACRAYSAPETLKRSPLDWAGVEGYWMRIVCFCDYRDLISEFFHSKDVSDAQEIANILRRVQSFCNQTSGWNPGFFNDEYQEASRLLRLNLWITSVESDPSVLERLPDPSRPPITFGGTMRGFNSDELSNRTVRGTVWVMRDGYIRWSFVSVYNDHDQWSSEGVQIGDVCSAAGVVGAWSGAHHGQGDPSGPFWLFKVEENVLIEDQPM